MTFKPATSRFSDSVQLHIERLVIDETLLAQGQAPRLQAAIESELARQFAASGISAAGPAALASLDAGRIHGGQAAPPTQLGRAIARSIHGAVQAANSPSSSPPGLSR